MLPQQLVKIGAGVKEPKGDLHMVVKRGGRRGRVCSGAILWGEGWILLSCRMRSIHTGSDGSGGSKDAI
jgi:hypothetical protein